MKFLWFLIVIALIGAMALGVSIARREALDVAIFLAGTLLVLVGVRAYLRRWRELERWEAWRTAEANLAARGGGQWNGGSR